MLHDAVNNAAFDPVRIKTDHARPERRVSPDLPHGDFVTDHTPQFYRRVLDHLPSPVIVVDADGAITYGNEAMAQLAGWTMAEGIGLSIADHIHPDDLPWVLESFAELTTSSDSRHDLENLRPWSPVRFRFISRTGTVIPIEVTGGDSLLDEQVQGVIYHVRPAQSELLLDEVFSGVASGESIESMMQPIVDLVTLPPLPIAAAVFEQRADGTSTCIATSDPRLADLPMASTDHVPWAALTTDPSRVEVESLTAPARDLLRAAGYQDCYHAGVHSPDHTSTLRIVACTPDRNHVAMGPMQRVERARELLTVVLLKAHNDRTLEESATKDALTDLPNRLGLANRFRRIEAGRDDVALLFVDLDEFKLVNDEYGHAVGDQVLMTVADRLGHAVRTDDVIARIGGDEFAVVLSEPAGRLGPEIVEHLADRVVRLLAQPMPIGDLNLELAASVGIALVGSDRTLDTVMDRADQAMYAAKRLGGGQYQIAHPAD